MAHWWITCLACLRPCPALIPSTAHTPQTNVTSPLSVWWTAYLCLGLYTQGHSWQCSGTIWYTGAQTWVASLQGKRPPHSAITLVPASLSETLLLSLIFRTSNYRGLIAAGFSNTLKYCASTPGRWRLSQHTVSQSNASSVPHLEQRGGLPQ